MQRVVIISAVDINECESHPCLNNGTCTDRVNGSTVLAHQELLGIDVKLVRSYCKENIVHFVQVKKKKLIYYSLVIMYVADINECESSPCLNNGTCTDQVNGFNCTCPPGFVGNRCNETG